jgi:hypothetical protein
MPGISYAVSLDQTVAYFVREANNWAMSHIGVDPQSLQLQAQITLASLVILFGARMRESHVTEVGARKFCETRASSGHTKWRELIGCNDAAPVTAQDLSVPNQCDASWFT